MFKRRAQVDGLGECEQGSLGGMSCEWLFPVSSIGDTSKHHPTLHHVCFGVPWLWLLEIATHDCGILGAGMNLVHGVELAVDAEACTVVLATSWILSIGY